MIMFLLFFPPRYYPILLLFNDKLLPTTQTCCWPRFKNDRIQLYLWSPSRYIQQLFIFLSFNAAINQLLSFSSNKTSALWSTETLTLIQHVQPDLTVSTNDTDFHGCGSFTVGVGPMRGEREGKGRADDLLWILNLSTVEGANRCKLNAWVQKMKFKQRNNIAHFLLNAASMEPLVKFSTKQNHFLAIKIKIKAQQSRKKENVAPYCLCGIIHGPRDLGRPVAP